MPKNVGSNPSTSIHQIAQSGGSLAQISDPKVRLELAKKGGESLARDVGSTMQNIQGLLLSARADAETESIRSSFLSQTQSLGEVATAFTAIIEAAEKGGGGLSQSDALKLEQLNEKAAKIKESMVELEKQLRFKNKKDDDHPGAAGAAPLLTVSVEA